MKRLLLIRHAKSSWSDPELADFERPLKKRGEKDAHVMGKRLAKQQLNPDCIIASPARRAIRTATIIAKEIGFPLKDIATDKQIYAADVADLLAVVQQIDDTCERVMVVGHNPGLSQLSQALTPDPIDPLPTCGIVCIDFALASWQELAPGRGTVVLFDYPKHPNT